MKLKKACSLLLAVLFTVFESFAQGPSLIGEISGVYAGTIPCADCQGIDYRISLLPDGTYHETASYRERSLVPIVNSGNFQIIGNEKIRLLGSSSASGWFSMVPGALLLLDLDGKEITGALASHYMLVKLTRSVKEGMVQDGGIITAPTNRNKFSRGISFYAMGNHPEWTLDVVDGRFIKFDAMGDFALNIPFGAGEKSKDAEVNLFSGASESGALVITLQKQTCSDTAARPLDYKVTVAAKYGSENEYRLFEGCGSFVPDFKLEGKWNLAKTVNRKSDTARQAQWIPTLTIDPEQRTYAAFDGCVVYTGKIIFGGKSNIRFMNNTPTEVDCDNTNSKNFIKGLAKTTTYQLNNNQLIFFNKNNVLLTMQQANNEPLQNNLLVDIWVLDSLLQQQVKTGDFRNGLPRLEINSDMNFTGTTGCNNISGNIIANGETIKMTIVKMTRMACNKANDEATFIAAINNATNYRIAGNLLTITEQGKPTLVFRKVD